MKWLAAIGCALSLSACSNSTAPQALTVGAYSYTSSLPFFKSDGSLGTSHFVGTLTLGYVSKDSIAGTWQVAGTEFNTTSFRSDSGLGFKNADAYVLDAFTTPDRLTIAHRIRPDLGCTAKYIGPDPYGTCTLTKQ
jgi:hypothetical protein